MFSLKSLMAVLVLPFALATATYAEDAKSVTIAKAWARATPGGATIGAAYAEISNAGAQADKLISIFSPHAGRAEIHTHAEEDGVMKMRRLESLEIPAGKSATLGPGGNHIMLFDLKGPLKAGETLKLTLVFEKAGEITANAAIAPIGAAGPVATDGNSTKSDPVVDGAGSESGSGSGSGSGSHSGQ